MSDERRSEIGASDEPVEDEVVESFDAIVEEGAERLNRTWAAVLVTGFSGGLEIGVGVMAYLAVLHETVREGNRLLADGSDVSAVAAAVRAMTAVLGVDPLDPHWVSGSSVDAGLEHALDTLVRAELDARANARKERDFATADAIRDRIKAAGVEVEDTASGPVWTVAGGGA